ncbi:MAG TPA: hypothetical protein PLY93_12285 [Turneriella sp.]|nr:hypothetical protein [Turneriella sp.]
MAFHFGDTLEKGEVDEVLKNAPVARWLVPVANDKVDELACSTEGLIQTFRASLVIVAKTASNCTQELIEVLQKVYTTSEDVAGVHDSPSSPHAWGIAKETNATI